MGVAIRHILSRNGAFRFHTIQRVSPPTVESMPLRCMKIRESTNLALRLRMSVVSGTAPLIGCRRPFSPSAERLCTTPKDSIMKKSTQPTSTGEPMGIVITTGIRAPIEPVVRAYMWGPAPDEPLGTDATRAA
jgi:hypothetical protein